MSTSPSQSPQGFFEENDDIDFVFNFNGQLIKSPPLSAAELFDGGKIKPLKLLSQTKYRGNDSPMTPRSPKRRITKAFEVSPPLVTTKQKRLVNHHHSSTRHMGQKRSNYLSTTSTEIASLSSASFSRSISSASSTSSSSSYWSKRWKFLFRTESEGHATEKEDYSLFMRKSRTEDLKRSENGRHLGTKDGRRVSAHEWHYKKNKEAAEERRWKTFLPYKKNLLGCMDLDPGSVSEVSRWIGVEITC